jgi:hypothetical protein
LWRWHDASNLTRQPTVLWPGSRKDPSGTLSCKTRGPEEITGILPKEGRKRKVELLLQGTKYSGSHWEQVWRLSWSRMRAEQFPAPGLLLWLAWVRIGSKVKVSNPGVQFLKSTFLLPKGQCIMPPAMMREPISLCLNWKKAIWAHKMIFQGFLNLHVFDC